MVQDAITPQLPLPGADRSGQVVGDYYLHRKLGEGGMGQVYLAEQQSLRRRVALKLLRPDMANSEVSRKRFEVEARAIAQLTHANVVQVYDFDTADGLPYLVLEYVDGRNLREFLERKGPPDLHQALSIFKQAAAALQRAAELGIIHRDVKPENILLTRQGEVKVTDFGLSRILLEGQPAQNLTQTGVTMGTPLYMSPEQVEGKALDHRTDVYSLGVTFYHVLAGEPPFKGDNAFAVALQHVQAEPPLLSKIRPDLPTELVAVIHKMMAKQPEQRYATAGEVLRDLKRLSAQLNGGMTGAVPLPGMSLPNLPALGGTTVHANAATQPLLLPTPERTTAWRRRVLVVATLVLAGMGGGLVAWTTLPTPGGDDAIDSADAANRDNNRQLLAAALGSYKQKEQALRSLVELSEAPGRERDDVQRGLSHRIDLAILYLDQEPRRLQEADDLFRKQAQSKVPEYSQFGKIGETITLAFRDDSKQSVEKVQEIRRRMELFQPPRYPRWSKLLADALMHNRKNYEAAGLRYPPELRTLEESLLRPGTRPGGPPAAAERPKPGQTP